MKIKFVIPAQAGIFSLQQFKIPACAGMTGRV